MPRKLKEVFNWDRLASLCQRDMSLMDCDEIMQVSYRTIERYIRKKYDLTFVQYRDKKMATTRLMIKETCLDHVKKGNITMAIFLAKNWCGMADKVENSQSIALLPSLTVNKLDKDGKPDGNKQVWGVSGN